MSAINFTEPSRLLGQDADTLRKAVYAALEEEAEYRGVPFHALTALGPNRVIRCFLSEPNIIWVTLQYAYFVRAIPEAFGYVTGTTPYGTVVVTTDEGWHVCDFKMPEVVEGLA